MKIDSELKIRQKDFLETSEGLIFAVVSDKIEEGRSLAFLRYIKKKFSDDFSWCKLNTQEANDFLSKNHPEYLYHSKCIDADLHAVPLNKIKKHHQPKKRLQDLMDQQRSPLCKKGLNDKLINLVLLLVDHGIQTTDLGITGSFLIGADNERSDFDLVIYDKLTFHKIREILKKLIHEGYLSTLDEKFWKDSYERRNCSLSYDEYVWHEARKFNKAVYEGVKFDLSLVLDNSYLNDLVYEKQGYVHLYASVVDDQYSFDSPSVYQIEHDEFDEVICFTPTYTGQALIGEQIEVSGYIETSQDGYRRVVVGSTREADGEYIKVVA